MQVRSSGAGCCQKVVTVGKCQPQPFVCISRLIAPTWALGGGFLEHQLVRQVILRLYFFLIDHLIPNKGNQRKSHNAVRNRQAFGSAGSVPPPVGCGNGAIQPCRRSRALSPHPNPVCTLPPEGEDIWQSKGHPGLREEGSSLAESCRASAGTAPCLGIPELPEQGPGLTPAVKKTSPFHFYKA